MTIEELENRGQHAINSVNYLQKEGYGADRARASTMADWSLVAVLSDIAIQLHRIGDFVDVVRKDYEKDHAGGE